MDLEDTGKNARVSNDTQQLLSSESRDDFWSTHDFCLQDL